MLKHRRLRRGSKRARARPCRDRLRVETQRSGGLRDRQAPTIAAIMDLGPNVS